MTRPETVDEIEARYSATAHRPITLAGLAGSWLAFANEIGIGYWGTIDDFTNDMTCRDLLQEAMGRVSETDRAWLEALTRPGDARYADVTQNDADDHLGRYYRHDRNWWWLRLPSVPGELRPYFDDVGW